MRFILLPLLLSACTTNDASDPNTDDGVPTDDGKADGSAIDTWSPTCGAAVPLTQAAALALIGLPDATSFALTRPTTHPQVRARHRMCYEPDPNFPDDGPCQPWAPGNTAYQNNEIVSGLTADPPFAASLDYFDNFVDLRTSLGAYSFREFYGVYGIVGVPFVDEVMTYLDAHHSDVLMNVLDGPARIDGVLTRHCLHLVSKVGKRRTKDASGNNIRIEGQFSVLLQF